MVATEMMTVSSCGERGPGYGIQWLDKHCEGTCEYYLTKLTGQQLCSQMYPTAVAMVYDVERKLFSLGVRPSNVDLEIILQHADEVVGDTQTVEELMVVKHLFPERLLYPVKVDGSPDIVTRCANNRDGHECKITTWARKALSNPVLTPNGPVFLRPVRWECTVHKQKQTAGSKDDLDDTSDPYHTSVPHYRLRNVRVSPELIMQLQGYWVESLCLQRSRRCVMMAWNVKAFEKIEYLKGMQQKLNLKTQMLVKACQLINLLESCLPCMETVTNILLTVYQRIVQPRMVEYDKAVIAFDGGFMRMDCTFAVARSCCVFVPTTGPDKKTTNRKLRVGGACLVIMGTEGLILRRPLMIPSESRKSVSGELATVMMIRRKMCGINSAPFGFGSDSMADDKHMCLELLYRVWPEMKAFDIDNPTFLFTQDIHHRQVKFTMAASTMHCDRTEYTTAINQVFHRLTLALHEHRAHDIFKKGYWDRRWMYALHDLESYHGNIAAILRKAFDGGCQLDAQECRIVEYTLSELGNAASTQLVDELDIIFIPTKILTTAARRVGMSRDEINSLFTVSGYEDAQDFIDCLSGTIDYYKVTRNRANRTSPALVTEYIGTQLASNREEHKFELPEYVPVPRAVRGHYARELSVATQQRLETGIADNEQTREWLRTTSAPEYAATLIANADISSLNGGSAAVEGYNRFTNKSIKTGSCGYDVTVMRMDTERLKWNATTMNRINGKISAGNSILHIQTLSAVQLSTLVVQAGAMKGIFGHTKLKPPKRTTVEDLRQAGYTFCARDDSEWTDHEVGLGLYTLMRDVNIVYRLFFQACKSKAAAPGIMGKYRTEYDWISASILKSRTPMQVRRFAEKLFNQQRINRGQLEDDDSSDEDKHMHTRHTHAHAHTHRASESVCVCLRVCFCVQPTYTPDKHTHAHTGSKWR